MRARLSPNAPQPGAHSSSGRKEMVEEAAQADLGDVRAKTVDSAMTDAMHARNELQRSTDLIAELERRVNEFEATHAYVDGANEH